MLGWIVTITIQGGKLAPTTRSSIPTTPSEAQRYSQHGLACKVESDGDGDGKFVLLPDEQLPKINVVSGPPKQIRIVAQQIVKPGQSVQVRSIVLDSLRNPLDAPYSGTIEIGWNGSEAKQRYESSRAAFSLTAPDKPGIYHIHAHADGLKDEYLPIKVTDRNDLSIYWGEMHGHTGFSDGVETPTDYYAYGRDVAMLDFCAVNDHAEQQLTDNRWQRSLAATREFYKPGEFVTLAGYEWTDLGHRNVYFAEAGDDTPLIWGKGRDRADVLGPREEDQGIGQGSRDRLPHGAPGGPRQLRSRPAAARRTALDVGHQRVSRQPGLDKNARALCPDVVRAIGAGSGTEARLCCRR